MQIQEIKLHDIQTIVAVQEYSLFYFSAIVVLVAIVLSYLLYKTYLWVKTRNKFNKRKSDKQSLDNIDLNNTKSAAYAIGLYGDIFKNDSPRHNEIYATLQEHLEAYKYKKQVEAFDAETLNFYSIYKEMCDV